MIRYKLLRLEYNEHNTKISVVVEFERRMYMY